MEFNIGEGDVLHVEVENLNRMPAVGNEVEINIDNYPPVRVQDDVIVENVIEGSANSHWIRHNHHQLQQALRGSPIVQLARLDFPPQRWHAPENDRVQVQEIIERVVEPPQEADDNARPAELAGVLAPAGAQLFNLNRLAPPLIDLDDSCDFEPAKKKLKTESKPETKQADADDDDDDADSGRLCPICMDYWSNSGEHRLCSLRCGHLFGHSCLLRWLQGANCTAGNRRCPQCNKKASVKDIRVIYATNVQVVDTVEIEMLKKELLQVTAEKNRFEMELTKAELRQKMRDEQIDSLTKRLHELERQKADMSQQLNQSIAMQIAKKFHFKRTLEICKDGGCRVLDYNKFHNYLAVSQKSLNTLFTGYGVRNVNVETLQPMHYVVLHQQAIRDLTFHPIDANLLLSVSFDKTAKIMDVRNNIVAHSYPVDGQVWSCCWSGDSRNIFSVGTQNGSIMQFDIRQTSGAMCVLETPGDRSPVVSLAAVPPNSSPGMIRGGILAAHLNTCCAYDLWNAGHVPKQLPLEGPFVSVRYNSQNHHALISSRPNNRLPYARHVVTSIEKGEFEDIQCNVVHTFNAGNSQKLLSRPCHVTLEDDTLVAAHQESSSCIPLWSITTGRQLFTLPVADPVLDMCSFSVNSSCLLATLSATKLQVYFYG